MILEKIFLSFISSIERNKSKIKKILLDENDRKRMSKKTTS
tara:strand:+ start:33 stop:155 length:123 start_codon:yes stop_codon:yes gene_type:complete